ncbi:MAG: ABC transporter substrate-binding protein [Dehalococcoidia bacterium]|nr:ABC transporter substrate-binding protein [Dehalococcoidia bacterium]
MRGIKWILAFSSISLIFVTACSPTISAPSRTTIDDLERTVNIESTPDRIVSLAPSNTEILFALGLGEKTVGVTEHCNYPPEALDKENVGGFSTPDIEKIIALQPDLVLASGRHAKEVIPALEETGLTVLALEPKNMDGILEDIQMVGKVTGSEEEASRLVSQIENRIKAITDKTRDMEKKTRVFYVTWHDPLYSAGSETVIQELIEKAGGINIFQDATGHKTADLELVIARNPEVIIACAGHGEATDKPFDWAKEEQRLGVTEARRNDRIYQIDADLVSRDGPRIVDALEWFACFIHPEVFSKPEGGD